MLGLEHYFHFYEIDDRSGGAAHEVSKRIKGQTLLDWDTFMLNALLLMSRLLIFSIHFSLLLSCLCLSSPVVSRFHVSVNRCIR